MGPTGLGARGHCWEGQSLASAEKPQALALTCSLGPPGPRSFCVTAHGEGDHWAQRSLIAAGAWAPS